MRKYIVVLFSLYLSGCSSFNPQPESYEFDNKYEGMALVIGQGGTFKDELKHTLSLYGVIKDVDITTAIADGKQVPLTEGKESREYYLPPGKYTIELTCKHLVNVFPVGSGSRLGAATINIELQANKTYILDAEREKGLDGKPTNHCEPVLNEK